MAERSFSEQLTTFSRAVGAELHRQRSVYPKYSNRFEAWAAVFEAIDAYWDEVRRQPGDPQSRDRDVLRRLVELAVVARRTALETSIVLGDWDRVVAGELVYYRTNRWGALDVERVVTSPRELYPHLRIWLSGFCNDQYQGGGAESTACLLTLSALLQGAAEDLGLCRREDVP